MSRRAPSFPFLVRWRRPKDRWPIIKLFPTHREAARHLGELVGVEAELVDVATGRVLAKRGSGE